MSVRRIFAEDTNSTVGVGASRNHASRTAKGSFLGLCALLLAASFLSIGDAAAQTPPQPSIEIGDNIPRYLFNAADFAFGLSDSNDVLEIAILTIPDATHGVLSYGATHSSTGTPVATGHTFGSDPTNTARISELSFVPAAVASGQSSHTAIFTYNRTHRDASRNRVTTTGLTANIVVTANAAPTTSPSTINIDEGPPVSSSLASVASLARHTFSVADFAYADANNDPLQFVTVMPLEAGNHGTLLNGINEITRAARIPAANIGNLVFRAPNRSQDYSASFKYTVTDSRLATSSEATMNIMVTATNDAFTARDDAVAIVTASTPRLGNVLFNDTDDSDHFPLEVVNYVAGTTYDAGSATAAGQRITGEGGYMSIIISTEGEYGGGGGGPSRPSRPGRPSRPNTSASIVFLPETAPLGPGEDVTESFTYRARNSRGTPETDEATVTFTIRGVNDQPVIVGDGIPDVTVHAGADIHYPITQGEDGDFDDLDRNDVLSYALEGNGNPSWLSLTSQGVLSGTAPAATGSHTVRVEATDQSGASTVDTFTLTIGANTAPTVTEVSGLTVAEDATHTFTAENFGFMDANAAGPFHRADMLRSVTIRTLPTHGTLVAGNPVAAGDVIQVANIGSLVFRPANRAANYTATFTYTVNDGAASSSDATMSIAVTVGANAAPTAMADTGAATDPTAGTVAAPGLLANDTDPDTGDMLTVVGYVAGSTYDHDSRTEPGNNLEGAYGTLNVVDDGGYTYTPGDAAHAIPGGESETDTFSYRMRDMARATSDSTLVITVTGANDAPTAVTSPLIASAAPGEDYSQDLNVAFMDPDGEDLTFSGAGSECAAFEISGSNLVGSDSGSVPSSATAGDQMCNVMAMDGDGESVSGTVTVTITATAATTPTTTPQDIMVDEGMNHTFTVDNFGFSGGTLMSIQVLSLPDAARGTLMSGGAPVTVNQVIAVTGGSTFSLVFSSANLSATESATFSYAVSNGPQVSAAETMTIEVTADNDGPTAVADVGTTGEDSDLSVAAPGLLANDTDPEMETLTVVGYVAGSSYAGSATTPGNDLTGAYGTLNVMDDGSYTYTPGDAADAIPSGDSETDAFSYRMVDDGSNNSDSTLEITVMGSNDPPTARPGPVSLNEGGTHTFSAADFGFMDSDMGDTLSSLAIVSLPDAASGRLMRGSNDVTAGEVIMAGDISNLSFSPAARSADYSATFAYTVNDGREDSASAATMNIMVMAGNADPVATNDMASATINVSGLTGVAISTGLSGVTNVLTGVSGGTADSDADVGDTIMVSRYAAGSSLGSSPAGVGASVTGSYGTLRMMADGSYTYEAHNDDRAKALAAGVTMNDVFTYEISDDARPTPGTATATLTIALDGINDAPALVPNTSVTPAQVGQAYELDLTTIVDDPDVGSTAPTFAPPVTGTGCAAFTLSGTDLVGSGSSGIIPGTTMTGSQTCSIIARDDGNAAGVIRITIPIVAAGAVTATPQAISVSESATHTFTAANFGFAPGSGGASLSSVTIEDAPADGTLRGMVGSATSVTEVNDGDTIMAANIGTLEYTPVNRVADYTATFTYTVSDGTNSSNDATMRIAVTAMDDAPDVMDDTVTATDPTAASGDLLSNDNDPEGDTLTVVGYVAGGSYAAGSATAPGPTASVTGAYGTLRVTDADGSYTYEPGSAAAAIPAGGSETDTFSYRVQDAGGLGSEATLVITVNGANNVPTARPATGLTVAEELPYTFTAANFGFMDADDGAALSSVTIVNAPAVGALRGRVGAATSVTEIADGNVIMAANIGTLEFRSPNLSSSATVTFTYTVSDGIDSSTPAATMSIMVTANNEVPAVLPDVAATTDPTAEAVAAPGLLANDDDPEGDMLTVVGYVAGGSYVAASATAPGTTASVTGTYGALNVRANGAFTYTPNAGAGAIPAGMTMTDVFSYQVSDGASPVPGIASATLTVTVTGRNSPPVAVDNPQVPAARVGAAYELPLSNVARDPDAAAGASLMFSAPGGGLGSGCTAFELSGSNLVGSDPNNNGAIPSTATQGSQTCSVVASDGNDMITVDITISVIDASAPTASPQALSVSESATQGFTAANFGFTAGSGGGASLMSVTIVNAPDVGTLRGRVGSATMVTDIADGNVIMATNIGTLVYTPVNRAVDYTATFTYTVSDGTNDSGIATMRITVMASNEDPTVPNAIADQTVNEGSPWSLMVRDTTFMDPDGDSLTLSAMQVVGGADMALPDWLGFTASPGTGAGMFSGTPRSRNQDVGVLTLKVTANDGNGGTGSDTFMLTVENVNDDPDEVTNPAIPAAGAGFAYELDLNSIFTDVDGDTLSFTQGASCDSAFQVLIAAKRLVGSGTGGIVPSATTPGSKSCMVTASDGNGGMVTGTVMITVSATAPPTATPESGIAVTEDDTHPFTAMNFGFASASGAMLSSVTIVSLPMSGQGELLVSGRPATARQSINMSDIGTLVFRPANRSSSYTATFTYTVNDGSVNSGHATMSIMVTADNDAPVATRALPVTTATLGAAYSLGLSPLFMDPDVDVGATPSFSIAQCDPAFVISGSSLVGSDTGDGVTRTTGGIVPSTATLGMRDCVVAVSDGSLETRATLIVEVLDGASQPPVRGATPLRNQMATVGEAFSYTIPSDAFSDPDGDQLSYSVIYDPSRPAWLSFVAGTGTFSGTPTLSDSGTSSTIIVTANDGRGRSVRGEAFSITVQGQSEAVQRRARDANTKAVLTEFARTLSFGAVNTVRLRVSSLGSVAPRFQQLAPSVNLDVSGLVDFAMSKAGGPGQLSDDNLGGFFSDAQALNALFRGQSHSSAAGDSLADMEHINLATLGGALTNSAAGDGGVPYPYSLRIWASAEHGEISATPQTGLSFDSDTTTISLGIEKPFGDAALLGLAGSWFNGEPDFRDSRLGTRGSTKLEQWSLSPYFGYSFGSLRVWGTVGMGVGDFDYTEIVGNTRRSASSNVSSVLYAAGVEHDVFRFEELDLLARVEGGGAHLRLGRDSGPNSLYGSQRIESNWIRGELEMGWTIEAENGSYRPFVTLGYRSDGGDAGTEDAVEYGGGLLMGIENLTVVASVRSQEASGGSGQDRTSYAVEVSYYQYDDARGLKLKVQNNLGRTDSGIWAKEYDYGSSGTSSAVRSSVNARVGYGIESGGWMLTPFMETDLHGSTVNRWSAGMSMGAGGSGSVELTHTVRPAGGSSGSGDQESVLQYRVDF